MQYPKIDLSKTTPGMVDMLLKARKHLAKSYDDEFKSASTRIRKDVYICFAIALACTNGGAINMSMKHPGKKLQKLIAASLGDVDAFDSWLIERGFNANADDEELQSLRLTWLNLMIDEIKAHHAIP